MAETRTQLPVSQLRIWKVAHTTFTLDAWEGTPWAVWQTDSVRDAEVLAEFAGRLCYQSWSNPSGRSNQAYLQNILAQEHFSVVEHAGFTVVLLGVSRSCTHELVRHRHFSFSQLSQRFYNEEDAAAVVPPLFREDPEALEILQEVYTTTQRAYRQLVELAQRKLSALPDRRLRRKRAREAARCVLPNMTETHIVMTGNHRSWREFFEKRGSLHADAEIREVALKIFTEVAQPLAPHLYQDFHVAEHLLPTGERVQTLERRRLEADE
ncbi:MAG: FAD-dependent thymidylate synthase [Armatimonadota bacterium]|nr:FAD-dependent thymidylate synthase [Armatimonadota bacterium]MDW8156608.1 FAD-dependent thymidylate synthase [Armatimonadota bacterium]